jgi:hypothetical protein
MTDPISSDNDNKSNITIDDITVFYKNNFINYSNISTSSYNFITKINIPNNVKYIGKINFYDIWLEKSHNIYLVGLPNSPLKSWYKIKNINEIEQFENYFTEDKMDLYNELGFFINLKNMNFNEFTRYLFLHEFTEKQIFETKKELNKMIKNNKLTYEDEIRILNSFILTNPTSFFIRLKYSKTLLYCESFNSNVIIKFYYNDLKMRNRYESWPKFSPSDIGILFSSFDVSFIDEIIENIYSDNITKNDIDILFKVNTDETKIKKINLKKIKSKEIMEYIKLKISDLECDKIFNKIDKDGLFKAFENSFDILLETFYEKINEDVNCQTNVMYLNDKLKNRLYDIFKIKLI